MQASGCATASAMRGRTVRTGRGAGKAATSGGGPGKRGGNRSAHDVSEGGAAGRGRWRRRGRVVVPDGSDDIVHQDVHLLPCVLCDSDRPSDTHPSNILIAKKRTNISCDTSSTFCVRDPIMIGDRPGRFG